MNESYYEKKERGAAERLEALLALPRIPDDGEMFSDGECFVPWDLFPALYGTYSKAFDDLAIAVLEDIQNRTFNRTDLASEMFREMLCTAGLCNYGTSPRVCFASGKFAALLPSLLDKWREYSEINWKS